MIESWVITLVGMVVAVVGAGFVNRYQTAESKKHIETLFGRLDKHGDDLVRLNTRSELSVTAKDVDDKYVSKEYFRQFEKHMDKRFDGLETGQGKILSFIEKISRKE